MRAMMWGVIVACAAGACGDDEVGSRPPLQVIARQGGLGASIIDGLFQTLPVELPTKEPLSIGARFDIGLDRPVLRRSIERYGCACAANAACPGTAWVEDDESCAACGDDPTTAFDETGRCLDLNDDGIADLVTSVAGVAELRCPDVPSYGVDGTYVTAADDTYLRSRLGELAPQTETVLVIQPQRDSLPTNSDCTLRLLGVLTDIDGQPFELPPVAFYTEPIDAFVPNFQPQGGDRRLRLRFNAELRPETLTPDRFELRTGDRRGPDVSAVTMDRDGTILELASPLEARRAYTVRMKPGIADRYGRSRPDDLDVAFSTAD